jgi:DNA-binding IclR family transcriptional regulator
VTASRPVSSSGTPSVAQRLLSLLDAFDADTPQLTLSQLARRTGLPVSTVHRLVRELQRWGGLERDEQGRYGVGLRLWEVGSLCDRNLSLREQAMPFLEDLYEATHENVQLAVLEGTQVLYLERIAGRRAVPVVSRPGGRLPAYATAVGHALVAYSSPEVQDRVLAEPLRPLTDRTVTDPARLRRMFAEVRRTGAAICDGFMTPDALSVAAPVFGPGDRPVAALSVVVRSGAATGQAYAPAVRTAARGITRVLRDG